LLTSETGREGKCRREGIGILQHYFQVGRGNSNDTAGKSAKGDVKLEQGKKDPTEDNTSLSLEEELKMLRSKKPSSSSNFAPYETGSKGSVFIMCTAEGCHMIPPIQVDCYDDNDKSPKTQGDDGNNEGKTDSDGGAQKQQRTTAGDANKETNKAEGNTILSIEPAHSAKDTDGDPWDPVPVVRKVFADLEQNCTTAPGSRFVTRMIPLQATCFASAVEIKATSEALLQKFFFPCSYQSFAVAFQKRICNNVKKPEIIDIIAGRILDSDPKYKVSLDNPDATIVVEICRTLCGISVVPRPHEMAKFSLVNAREKAALDGDSDE